MAGIYLKVVKLSKDLNIQGLFKYKMSQAIITLESRIPCTSAAIPNFRTTKSDEEKYSVTKILPYVKGISALHILKILDFRTENQGFWYILLRMYNLELFIQNTF